MAPAPAAVDDLLDRADAARASGRGSDAAALYDEAIALARAEDDLDAWSRAALRAAAAQVFGSEPGGIPAHLYEIYVRTENDRHRAQLAAALARSWSYAGEAARAQPFGEEAARLAEQLGEPLLLVDCLDAALVTHWGPDDLDLRQELAGRLDDVAAHVTVPDERLRAHLWAFQVACEVLDLPRMHRHLRAIEALGRDSARARFFGATRRWMLDGLRGRLDTAPALRAMAAEAAEAIDLPDAWMALGAMDGFGAWMRGDLESCVGIAELMETFAVDEGLPGVCSEAALVWVGAARLDRASALLGTLVGRPLAEFPRDVNWLQTMQCALEVALSVDDRGAVVQVAELLSPYEDRAVINAGAVMFHGVTDDPLSRAHALLGDHEAARRCRERALGTYRRIGASWWHARLAASTPPHPDATTSRGGWTLMQQPGGTWLVGGDGRAVPVRDMRGLAHLRELLRRAGTDVPALDLAGQGSGSVDSDDLGPVLDDQARRAYKTRLDELEVEMTEAEDWSDVGRLETLRGEREALIDQLAAATGLSGRRRAPGSSRERARVTVRKAIVAAMDRLEEVDQQLAHHLRDHVHTGAVCRYEPDRDHPVDWTLFDPQV